MHFFRNFVLNAHIDFEAKIIEPWFFAAIKSLKVVLTSFSCKQIKTSTKFFGNVNSLGCDHPNYYNIHGPPLGFVFQLLQLCAKIYLMTASEAEAIMAKEGVSLFEK